MAVLADGLPVSKFSSDIREARIYINELNINKFSEPLDEKNLAQYKKEIIEVLNKNKKKAEANTTIETINLLCANRLLPKKSFDWIKNDDRACYYVWGKTINLDTTNIRDKKINDIFKFGHGSIVNKKETPNKLEALNLNKHPADTQERIDQIILIFDLIDLDIQKKEKALHDIKNEWSDIYSQKNNFRWLDFKNKEICEWAWNYIKNHSDFCINLSPINDYERYLCFYAAFDLWSAGKDTKKLFNININKAISQQKFRAGIKNKKALNTFIDKKAKEQLEFLSKNKNMRINQVIEYLIESEFNKLKKTKDD